MSNISEKLETVAQNVQKVYDKGVQDGLDKYEYILSNKYTDYSYYFYTNVRHENGPSANVPLENIPIPRHTSSGKSFARMFGGPGSDYYSGFKKVPYFDTGNGINFSYMFYQCNKLTEVPLYNTSNGTDFSYMFSYCISLLSVPLFNTQNGKNFSFMFSSCKKIAIFPDINTSKGTNFSYMFSSCSSMINVPNIDVSLGTDFRDMLSSCVLLTDVYLDTLNGTRFDYMFWNCTSLKSVTVNISKATSLSYMFSGCTLLESITFINCIKISGLNLSSCPLTDGGASIISDSLYDYSNSSTTYILKLGTTNLGKLTDEQKAIATNKGWTLS